MDYVLQISTGVFAVTGSSIDMDQSDRPEQCYNSWVDTERAMTLTGETDEDEAALLIDRLTAMLNNYLLRDLRNCTHLDTFFAYSKEPGGPSRGWPETFFLQNWPIGQIHSIRYDGERVGLDQFQIDYELGTVKPVTNARNNLLNVIDRVTINYTAGYSPTPAEIDMIFEEIMVTASNISGTGTTGIPGAIKKTTLVGLGAVEFNVPTQYSGASQQGIPELLRPYIGLLDTYRSDRKLGVI